MRGTWPNEHLQQQLLHLHMKIEKNVFLFSSPQNFVTSIGWQEMFLPLVQKGMVNFTSVNECILYAGQGVKFQHEFSSLKGAFFSLLEVKPIPILFMTATATHQTLLNLEGLTGLPFDPSQLLWLSNIGEVQCHNVDLELIVSESPFDR